MTIGRNMYVGIDLAAKEKNETGLCILDGELDTQTIFKDKKILQLAKKASVVAIDAPLTESEKPFRKAERELMKEFGPMLPLNTPGMKILSKRAQILKKSLQKECEVIETYPRAVEKVCKIEKTKSDFESGHEFDAYLCALTAKSYSEDKYKEYGEGQETIILPSRS